MNGLVVVSLHMHPSIRCVQRNEPPPGGLVGRRRPSVLKRMSFPPEVVTRRERGFTRQVVESNQKVAQATPHAD